MEKSPVFVKIENHKELLDIMAQIRGKTEEAKNMLRKISELKNEEDTELQSWRDNLEEVERKVEFISKLLGEP